MLELMTAFGPILMFMLIPIWIPMITTAIGATWDLVSSSGTPRGGGTRSVRS